MTPASRSVLARAEADRDEGLADRDDHDQPVPLEKCAGCQPPAADIDEERPEEADRGAQRSRAPTSSRRRRTRQRGSTPRHRGSQERCEARRERSGRARAESA